MSQQPYAMQFCICWMLNQNHKSNAERCFRCICIAEGKGKQLQLLYEPVTVIGSRTAFCFAKSLEIFWEGLLFCVEPSVRKPAVLLKAYISGSRGIDQKGNLL